MVARMNRHTIPSEAIELSDSILEEFDDIAIKLNIFHFLWKGTCLGLYRDKTYTVTDLDIDVGVLCPKEKRETLYQELLNQGFIKKKQKLFINRIFIKNDIHLDVNHIFMPKYYAFVKEFEQLDYKGRMYNIPCPVEDYLVAKYGVDWYIPQNWEWVGDKWNTPLGIVGVND